MPWWAWLSIGILAVISLGFSGWYLLSASNYWITKKTFNWNRFFLKHQPLSEQEIIELKNTPIALLMVVGFRDPFNQKWQPLYLLPSSNCAQTISHWNQELNKYYESQIPHPIAIYLKETKQTPADIKFYVFNQYQNDVLLNKNFSKLINKSNLKVIGFNKLIV